MSFRHGNEKESGESQQENDNSQQQQQQQQIQSGVGVFQDLQQQQHLPYGMASSYQSSTRQQFTRSHPIAIKRTNNNNPYDSNNNHTGATRGDTSDEDDADDEEEEDDDSLVANVERDAVRLGLVDSRGRRSNLLTSHSLPSRLLRAPLLGSVPTNEDYLLYRNIPTATLPPPMTLNDQPPSLSGVAILAAADRTSYGSLRESHQKGRFLDGPSSYRDSRTGDICRMEQRVRFERQAGQNTTSSSDSNTSDQQQQQPGEGNLSIRDRMKQARERNSKKATAARKRPTSSLAAMFDDPDSMNSNTDSSSGATPATFHDFSSPFYENHISALPSGALSTSLTGLELLQRGLRLATITDHDSQPSADDQQLPRDANGHNGLLSRSLSDPRGTVRRLAADTRSPVLPSLSQAQQPAHPFLPPPLQLGGTFLSPTAAGGGGERVVVSHLSAALQQQQPSSSLQQAPLEASSDGRATDADLEGAFEMDLE